MSFGCYCYGSLHMEKGGGGVGWFSPLEGRRAGCSLLVGEGGDVVGCRIVNLITKEGKLYGGGGLALSP